MDALVELLQRAMDIFFHLDQHLVEWTTVLGSWVYVLLFVIVFCETGLVVTPFLPGDSLLFATGALTAVEGSPLNPFLVGFLLIVAGVLGDGVNYAIGKHVGPKIFSREDSIWFHKTHLTRAQLFYERYGGKAIVFARFVPIVRTFAPFVAGIGKMEYRRFAVFNVFGAILWVGLFVTLGNQFGSLPVVKKNFQYVIIAVIVLSVLPAVYEIWREKRLKT